MAIAKLVLLILGVLAQQYAATPPNGRPPTEHLREQRGAEHAMHWALVSFKMLLYAWALLEASVLIVALCPPTLTRHLPPILVSHTWDPTLTPLSMCMPTPAFIAGTALALAGAFLRVHCFRALGARFTLELSIRPAHALMTHGVYGIVRHPSYTGGLAHVVGLLLCVLDPRGVVVSVLASATRDGDGDGDGGPVVTAVLACAWAAALCTVYVMVSKRMDKEDAMLEKHFGDEWRAWARRVPYRLVPGVY